MIAAAGYAKAVITAAGCAKAVITDAGYAKRVIMAAGRAKGGIFGRRPAETPQLGCPGILSTLITARGGLPLAVWPELALVLGHDAEVASPPEADPVPGPGGTLGPWREATDRS